MITARRVATPTAAVLRATVACILVAGLTVGYQAGSAAAAQQPLFASDFTDGLAGWRVVTGAASEWTEVHDGLDYVTVDTRNQTSGRYLTVDPRLGTVRTAGGPVDPADDVIQARPGDQITVSYGLGSFTRQAKITVAAAGEGQ